MVPPPHPVARPPPTPPEGAARDPHIPHRRPRQGDFNEWLPGSHELRKRANGTRSASVTVPMGTRLRFRYLGEDGTWFNDPDVADHDGSDSVLVV